MISPTGQGVRLDSAGDGRYGAPRGSKSHKGVDYLCRAGVYVVSPISGIVVRESKPYSTGDLSGLVIQGDHMTIKMFYFKPFPRLIGCRVSKGQAIGTAQSVSAHHNSTTMKDHIHLEITSIDPSLFINDVFEG